MTESTEHVVVEHIGRVRRITMNRPRRKNALSHAMYAAMADAVVSAGQRDDVRAVVITGAGDAFTSGNDLNDFITGMPEGIPPVWRFLEAIRDFEKPLIAAVNGAGVGIGLTMLLHCDLAFASETATLQAPFAEMGLVPEAGASMLLPRAVGVAWANDILLAGRRLTAAEALTAGLVSRVLPAETLLAETMAVAERVAGLAPGAMKHSKRLIRGDREALTAHMQAEGLIFMKQLASNEFFESIQARFQKRAPQFD